ncbi:MAG: SDR family oxidoreductase [Chlorobiaceae bacterium]
MHNIVITGSTRGIGFGLARAFLERGHRVTINGSRRESLECALQALKSFGERVHGVEGSVSDRSAMEQLFSSASERFGGVDIWVNNAGIGHSRRMLWELEESEIRKVIEVNLLGAVNGTVAAYSAMTKQGSGKIFNMEGLGSEGFIKEGLSGYGTSKSALHYFTRAFAAEAKASPVQIGLLSPGMVITDMLFETVAGAPDPLGERRFFNKVADDVPTVSAFLANRMLKSNRKSDAIRWMTKRKMIFRMLFGSLRRKDFFSGGKC